MQDSHVDGTERLLEGHEEHSSGQVRHALALPPDRRYNHGHHECLPQVDSIENLGEWDQGFCITRGRSADDGCEQVGTAPIKYRDEQIASLARGT